jgi:hypothetical protein
MTRATQQMAVLDSCPMAQELKAHVHNGQVVLDEPLDLPEGTPVRIVADIDANLEASLARGLADVRGGRTTDADEFLAELEAEDATL